MHSPVLYYDTPSENVIEAIQRLFDRSGVLQYGESVTQLDHALQCGLLAERSGAPDALVVAAVLHDIGHILHRDAAAALEQGQDDAHELIGARQLQRWFGAGVAEPVRLHVMAKRYLCATDSSYSATLSPLSQRTLELQGGAFTQDEASTFEGNPYAQQAVALRRWDDMAKRVGHATPPLEHYLQRMARLAQV